MPTAYFDKDDLARLTYLENNPCSSAHGSLDSVVNDLDYDKCKARAVIMGNGMCYPRDHGLTHAPTTRETTVRTEMCRALHKAYHCKVFDISQAFTYGRPDRHVHLEFPAGMKQEYGKDGDRKCKYLNFNLYGSPSGPRYWNVTLHKKILKMGFDQSTADPSLYNRGELHVCMRIRR
jgi:hypothetical protein